MLLNERTKESVLKLVACERNSYSPRLNAISTCGSSTFNPYERAASAYRDQDPSVVPYERQQSEDEHIERRQVSKEKI